MDASVRRRDWFVFWAVLAIVPLSALFAPKAGAATGDPYGYQAPELAAVIVTVILQVLVVGIVVLFLTGGVLWLIDMLLDRRDDRRREHGEVGR